MKCERNLVTVLDTISLFYIRISLATGQLMQKMGFAGGDSN